MRKVGSCFENLDYLNNIDLRLYLLYLTIVTSVLEKIKLNIYII